MVRRYAARVNREDAQESAGVAARLKPCDDTLAAARLTASLRGYEQAALPPFSGHEAGAAFQCVRVAGLLRTWAAAERTPLLAGSMLALSIDEIIVTLFAAGTEKALPI